MKCYGDLNPIDQTVTQMELYLFDFMKSFLTKASDKSKRRGFQNLQVADVISELMNYDEALAFRFIYLMKASKEFETLKKQVDGKHD